MYGEKRKMFSPQTKKNTKQIKLFIQQKKNFFIELIYMKDGKPQVFIIFGVSNFIAIFYMFMTHS